MHLSSEEDTAKPFVSVAISPTNTNFITKIRTGLFETDDNNAINLDLNRGAAPYGYAGDANRARDDPDLTVRRGIWNHFQYSSPIWSEFIRASPRRIRRLRAGTRSCGPGTPVYDYRSRGAPSHRLGRIHPYVRSCSAAGTDRERSDWRT